MASSLAMAKHLGQFKQHVAPDWTRIDSDHLIIGDGTYVKPFSSVKEVVDQKTGAKVVLGSRAASRPRIQRVITDSSQDAKTAIGINHVTIVTPTRHGWIVLAVDHALASEIRTATPMIEQLTKLAGDGIHTVTWDSAYSGISKEILTANNGLLALTKPVARPDQTQLEHVGAAIGEDEAISRYEAGQALPLGTSVFPTTKGHAMVRTWVYPFGQIPGTNCEHELWVDGESLVDVSRAEVAQATLTGQPVKIAHAHTVSATRHRNESGSFGVKTEWSIPCKRAGEHRFTTVSAPRTETGQPAPDALPMATNTMSSLPRTQTEQFADGYGYRNMSESFNSWFKSRLGTTAGASRAMRLKPEHQGIDHICIGLIANSNTHLRFRESKSR